MAEPEAKGSAHILMTGCTGFLGSYMLFELLQQDQGAQVLACVVLRCVR